jgi:hypothetical protein
MHKLFASTVSVLALAAIAQAQTYVFAPDNGALTQPSSSTLAWRDSTTGFRSQFIYDTSHFTSFGVNGPCVINRMRFRAANNNTAVGGSYPGDGLTTGVTIDIGTSATDYNAASTTYATNRGVMQNVMTLGTVTVAAGAGTTPNNYVIDIAIPGGFVYDPTLGQDLLIEVSGPDFIGTIPSMATGVSLAASRCQRVANTTTTGLTGTFSGGFCPVVLFDILGPGGLPDNGSGFPVLIGGAANNYGVGCGPKPRSFAELFPIAAANLDLGTGFTMIPDVAGAPTSYTLVPGIAAPMVPVTGTALLNNAATPAVMADDAMSQACTLPWAFPFVGGSTSTIHANTNGYITLAATAATGGDFSPTLAEMVTTSTSIHSGLPRFFPCWYDLYGNRNVTVNPAAGVYFQVDPVTNKAIVTWNDVGELATTVAGAKSFNFQVELSQDGTIEVRYGAMSTFGSTSQSKIVGFTPGAGSLVPPSVDLSVAMPFQTGVIDALPLTMSATRPTLGLPFTVTADSIPAPGLTLNWISTVQFNPGIDLAILGAPGCGAYMDANASVLNSLLIGVGTQSFNVTVPSNPVFTGVSLYTQSAAASTFNALGFQTSNAVALTIGNVP